MNEEEKTEESNEEEQPQPEDSNQEAPEQEESSESKEDLSNKDSKDNYWKQRALNAEQTIEQAKRRRKEEEQTSSQEETTSQSDLLEQKVDLRMEGYSKDEISEIEAYANAKKLSLTEAKDSPFVQKAIEGLREEKKVEESTPSPSSRSVTVENKTFADMSEAERKKNFTQVAQQAIQKSRGRGNSSNA